MSLCSYPTNGLVSTTAPDHHGCIKQLHITSSHVLIRRILSACTSVTSSSYQHPCILHLHPTISHICNNCTRPFPMSLTVASNQQSYHSVNLCLQTCMSGIHLHWTSIHICYSNIQPSVLSVALATDQKSSNGCYNCTGQADMYQWAVKMVKNICSMQIPYSGVVFCVVTLHSISIFFVNFSHPSSWLFYAQWFKKIVSIPDLCPLSYFVLWSNTLSQSFQWYRPFSIPCHLSLHFLKERFPKEGIFTRIIWYGIIRYCQKWSGECMVHALMDTIPRTKAKTLPLQNMSES